MQYSLAVRRFAAITALIAACGGQSGGDVGADASPPRADAAPQPEPDASPEFSDECTARHADAFTDGKSAFAPSFMRWSCLETPGLGADLAQEEYCEYFAIVSPPPVSADMSAPPTSIHGRLTGPEQSFGASPTSLSLNAYQIATLDSQPDQVAGHCIFSSWNFDNELPCTGECSPILGLPLDAANFRMRMEVNSEDAAFFLATDCYTADPAIVGDPADGQDRLHDPFYRGCVQNANLNETEHRKSDSTLCAGARRLGECGCSDDPSLFDSIAQTGWPGFALGAWSGFVAGNESASQLPAGCEYLNFGDNGQRAVACEISASELITAAGDLVLHCKNSYADQIVVHATLPNSIGCSPETGTPYSETCGDEPWVLGTP